MIFHFQCQRCYQWIPFLPGLEDTEFCTPCRTVVNWQVRQTLLGLGG